MACPVCPFSSLDAQHEAKKKQRVFEEFETGIQGHETSGEDDGLSPPGDIHPWFSMKPWEDGMKLVANTNGFLREQQIRHNGSAIFRVHAGPKQVYLTDHASVNWYFQASLTDLARTGKPRVGFLKMNHHQIQNGLPPFIQTGEKHVRSRMFIDKVLRARNDSLETALHRTLKAYTSNRWLRQDSFFYSIEIHKLFCVNAFRWLLDVDVMEMDTDVYDWLCWASTHGLDFEGPSVAAMRDAAASPRWTVHKQNVHQKLLDATRKSPYFKEYCQFAQDCNLSTDGLENTLLFTIMANVGSGASTFSLPAHTALATRPDIVKKLQQEYKEYHIDQQSTLDPNEDSHEALLKMPYLDAVFTELLRLYHFPRVLSKVAQRDVLVADNHGTKFRIKKGETVSAAMFLANRDPTIFENPDALQPERFLSTTSDGKVSVSEEEKAKVFAFGGLASTPKMRERRNYGCAAMNLLQQAPRMWKYATMHMFLQFTWDFVQEPSLDQKFFYDCQQDLKIRNFRCIDSRAQDESKSSTTFSTGEIEQEFKAAAKRVTQVNAGNTLSIFQSANNKEIAMLYGLYKQALFGDAPTAGANNSILGSHNIPKPKLKAWAVHKGKPSQQVMSEYVEFVSKIERRLFGDKEAVSNKELAKGSGQRPTLNKKKPIRVASIVAREELKGKRQVYKWRDVSTDFEHNDAVKILQDASARSLPSLANLEPDDIPESDQYSGRNGQLSNFVFLIKCGALKPPEDSNDSKNPTPPPPMDDINAYLKVIHELAPTLVDSVDTDWRSDKAFARNFFAGPNPILVERCEELPASLVGHPETDALLGKVKNGRVYKVDYSIMVDIKEDVPAPLVLLQVDEASQQNVPIAIQLDQKQSGVIFTPQDAASDWQLAKLWVRVVDNGILHVCTHYLLSHIIQENFAIAFHRCMPRHHPLFAILSGHFRNAAAATSLGHTVLFDADGVANQCLQSVSGHIEEVMERTWDTISLQSFLNMPKYFEERNVSSKKELPDYPYRDDALSFWNTVLLPYVEAVVMEAYPTDEDVGSDKYLKEWLEVAVNVGFRGQTDLSPKVDSIDELIELLTGIIFNATAFHSMCNALMFKHLAFLPMAPPSLKGEYPREKRGVAGDVDITALLPAYHETKTLVGTITCLSNHEVPGTVQGDESLLGEEQIESDNEEIQAAFSNLKANFARYQKTIERRNRKREPYFGIYDKTAHSASW